MDFEGKNFNQIMHHFHQPLIHRQMFDIGDVMDEKDLFDTKWKHVKISFDTIYVNEGNHKFTKLEGSWKHIIFTLWLLEALENNEPLFCSNFDIQDMVKNTRKTLSTHIEGCYFTTNNDPGNLKCCKSIQLTPGGKKLFISVDDHSNVIKGWSVSIKKKSDLNNVTDSFLTLNDEFDIGTIYQNL